MPQREFSFGKWSPGRRRWRRWLRRAKTVVLLALLGGGLVAADRAGFFGRRQEADMPRYHKRSFRCTRVVDGDTLDIDIPDGQWKTTRIRLWGVDTPETVRPNTPPQYFGPEASAFTKRLAEGETLRIELLPHDTRDKYGRLLAYVHLPDGTMLNRRLVEEGYGYADPRFEHRRQSEFRKAMTQAQEKKRGLWAHPHPVDWPDYMKKEGTEK